MRLSTSTLPLRSTTFPRGACTRMSRTWLLCACARYLSPERTCRYQRRKKMIANPTRAIPPMIATRSASWGVIAGRFSLSRYRVAPLSDLEASQADGARLDRGGAAFAPHRVGLQDRAQDAADQPEHGQRQQRVEDDREEHVAERVDAQVGVEREQEADDRHAGQVARRGGGRYRDRQKPMRGLVLFSVAPD